MPVFAALDAIEIAARLPVGGPQPRRGDLSPREDRAPSPDVLAGGPPRLRAPRPRPRRGARRPRPRGQPADHAPGRPRRGARGRLPGRPRAPGARAPGDALVRRVRRRRSRRPSPGSCAAATSSSTRSTRSTAGARGSPRSLGGPPLRALDPRRPQPRVPGAAPPPARDAAGGRRRRRRRERALRGGRRAAAPLRARRPGRSSRAASCSPTTPARSSARASPTLLCPASLDDPRKRGALLARGVRARSATGSRGARLVLAGDPGGLAGRRGRGSRPRRTRPSSPPPTAPPR